MGDQNEGLNVRELFENTYSRLLERHNPQEVVLQGKALAEIANDSDWHRTRVGCMRYENVGLFQFDRKIWAIARGENGGGYPADLYDSDLLALEFLAEDKTPEQIQKELRKEIRQSSYFRNSLVYAMADGNLAVNKEGRFRGKILEKLQPEISRFIAQEPEYDSQYLSLSTLRPICKSSFKYKLELADFLADSIEAVLKKE